MQQTEQQIEWWHALLLGLAQGLTEFIPVSSSAHLNILHWLFGQGRELPFDVLLHVGTLFALAFYFRHDWVALFRDSEQHKLRNLVFAACVPAVIAGLLSHKLQDEAPLFADVCFNATMLIVAGLLLLLADRSGRKSRSPRDVRLADAVIIGCSQAFALIPGVSRSGATLTAGLLCSFEREAAARFSFLMSLPITLGAVAYEFYKDIYKAGGFQSVGASVPVILLGIVASGLSGFWAIGFLLNFLKTRDVTPFVVWRVFVALVVFALFPFISR